MIGSLNLAQHSLCRLECSVEECEMGGSEMKIVAYVSGAGRQHIEGVQG